MTPRERAVCYSDLAERCRAEQRLCLGPRERAIYGLAALKAKEIADHFWGLAA